MKMKGGTNGRLTFVAVGVALIAWVGLAAAGGAPVADTGQTQCFDALGVPRDCTGTGEDGEFQAGVDWPMPRFTVNGDGTVKDNLTGLIWLKDANCPAGTKTWQQALDWVVSLNTTSIACTDYTAMTFTDWRLPNVKELSSLIDFGRLSPALPALHPFVNVNVLEFEFYWSSSSVVPPEDPILAWVVELGSGIVGTGREENANSEDSKASLNHVWAVRGGLSGDFKFNAGLNDAWFNPLTDGQGFFIIIFPDLGFVTLAWFTYDTELPPIDAIANLRDPGHRWLTALGVINGNMSVMEVTITSEGLFDTSTAVVRVSDGTITLTFNDCKSGTVKYNIPSINRQGIVPIQRVANDNIALCDTLSAAAAGGAPVERTGQTQCFDASGVSRDCTGTGEDGEFQAGVDWPMPRFTDNGDGTVTDNLTDLIWLKDANCSAGTKTWQQALDWVVSLNTTSIACTDYTAMTFTDWRLPNVKELSSLIDFGRLSPALPALHPFVNVNVLEFEFYWSSSSVVPPEDPILAWVVQLGSGIVGTGPGGTERSKADLNHVWAVRGGQ